MTATTTLMNVTSDFWDATTTGTTVYNGNNVTIETSYCYTCHSWHCCCHGYVWYPWTYTYTPKITLSLSEANLLKREAKKNKKLRDILDKFTPHIAVDLSFE